MTMRSRIGACAIAALGAAAVSSPCFAATNDACSLLTAADVGAALGTPAGAGEPVTPTDHKVCTWKAADGKSWVTLMLQPASAYDGGIRLAGYSNGKLAPQMVSGLGEGAYFLPVGDQVGLMVKKGAVAFKVAVYQHGPVEPKETAERALGAKVAGRL
jgi:hypothetical protein